MKQVKSEKELLNKDDNTFNTQSNSMQYLSNN